MLLDHFVLMDLNVKSCKLTCVELHLAHKPLSWLVNLKIFSNPLQKLRRKQKRTIFSLGSVADFHFVSYKLSFFYLSSTCFRS
jgi:hypothetical protein